MLIRRHFRSEPRSSEITPREVYLARRNFMRGGLALGAGLLLPGLAHAQNGNGLSFSPGPFSTDEPKTPWEDVTTYNNFYELGTGKSDPSRNAEMLRTEPWSVVVDGACANPGRYALEDFLKPWALEERIYRLRCVEGWSMVIPWVGFPLSLMLEDAGLTSRAHYVEFFTLHDPEQMPNQTSSILDWPYREGLRIDEAMHPLTLMAVGMYGEVMPKQSGAPIRLVVPWKYGFKSIKSVVRIDLREDRPVSSWEARQPREYGFFANVNPEVRHPRWHQATERRLPDGGRIRTEMFNGYAEEVAHLYEGMDLTENF